MSFIGNQKDSKVTAVGDKANGAVQTGFLTVNVALTNPVNSVSYRNITANSNTDILNIRGAGVSLSPNASPRTLTISTNSDLRVSQNSALMAVNNWTTWSGSQDSLSSSSIAWSPELGLFVSLALAADASGFQAMTSPDGFTWTRRTVPDNNSWNSVAWSPELGLFVAVSSSGSLNRAMTSSDGITWITRTTTVNNPYSDVIWCKELGLFVAVAGSTGAADVNKHIMTSPDGTAWTAQTTPNDNFTCVTWSKELGLLVALGFSAANKAMSSSDGINWTLRSLPAGAATYGGVSWSPELGLFVAVGNDMVYSPDGLTWTQASTYPAGFTAGTRVVWNPQFEAFVAVADSGTSQVALSFDGITWRGIVGLSGTWKSLAWSPELGIHAAVAPSGNFIMTSRPVGVWGAIAQGLTHAQVMSHLYMRY